MKFRHKSNFVALDLDQIILAIIDDSYYDSINQRNLSKLLAGILLQKDVESLLGEFEYVRFEE
jgi:hypothetical protein